MDQIELLNNSLYLTPFNCVQTNHHHFYQDTLTVQNFVILSCHPSLSSIAPGRSSWLYPVFSQSWCKSFSRRPTLAHPSVEFHKRILLMSSFWLLQLWSAYLVRLVEIVCKMGGCWLYSCCFFGCWFQDFWLAARIILMSFPSNLFFLYFVSIHVMYSYRSIDIAAASKKFHFILSERSDFHMIDNLPIQFHAVVSRMLTSLSVDEMLLLRYVNRSSNFRGLLLRVEIAPFCLKHIYSVLFAFT